MIFGSVCSGIEAASQAWHPLGWKTAYVAEIEPFPCAVLAQRLGATRPRYLPEGVDPRPFAKIEWGDAIPNYGDFTRIADDAPGVDVLVGGTPCQAFSVAGARQSLADERGNLTLEFVRLAHAHTVHPTQPLRYAVWENVPGVLSTDDNAFGCFLAGLVGGDDPLHVPGGERWPDSGMVEGPLGRAAWRVLDAQHFGLAQRRRRVFLVFCPRASGGDPAAILFERQSLPWDFEASREEGQGTAGGAVAGPDCGVAPTLSARSKGGGGLGTDFDLDGGLVEAAIGSANDVAVAAIGGNNTAGAIDVATACNAHGGPHGRLDFESETFVTHAPILARCVATREGSSQDWETTTMIAHTLRGDGFDASEDGTGRGTPLVPCVAPAHAFDARQQDVVQYGDLSGPLDTDGESVGVLPPIAFSGKDYGADATEDMAPTLRAGMPTRSHQNGGVGPAIAYSMMPQNSGKDFTARPVDVAQPLMAAGPAHGNQGGDVIVTSPPEAIAFDTTQVTSRTNRSRCDPGAPSGSLAAKAHAPALAHASQVRRLTPRECERLQGFPDDYTRIRIRHFAKLKITKNRPADMWDRATDGGWWLMAADGPRYKALGNSMADTVMSWLGQRIAAYEAGTLDGWHFDWSLIPWVLRPAAARQGSTAIPITQDALRGEGTALTPSPDAEGRVRLRDPGFGVGSPGDPAGTITAASPGAVAVST